MRHSDLDTVVEIHMESFPQFFLTFLGRDFLSLLYRSMLDDAEGVILVSEAQGKVEGFVAGVTGQAGFYGRLIRRRLVSFALASLGAALRRPRTVPRLLRALLKPGESAESVADACLMSLAVRPGIQGRGLGRQLVQAFCRTLAERGVTTICLTTDRSNNERVNLFYESLGFRVGRTFVTAEGRMMNEYVMTVDRG